MVLADDPRAFILRMFELEIKDGRGGFCELFPNGVRPQDASLQDGEFVYGIYKSKYLYSSQSFLIRDGQTVTKIPWSQVAHCSTTHGDGSKSSTLTLTNGSKITVAISEFVKGWSGRTSQLYHGMIERWGANTSFGAVPLTIVEFFDRATDDYCFAPNLEPHPPLSAVKSELEALSRVPNIGRILLIPCNADGEELTVRRIVVVSDGVCPAVFELGKTLSASSVGSAEDETLRLLGSMCENRKVVELVWD